MDNELSLVNPQGKEDLQAVQKEKYDKALTNLITGRTPKDVIFQKPSGHGSSVDYVPGWWFVDQLNSLFGYNWDFEILDQGVQGDQIWVKGKLTVRLGLSVITKVAYGGGKMKSKTNAMIDLGDDYKSAATDSLKKAATLLGLAADIYGKREVLTETSPAKSQLETVYKIGLKKGLDREAVDKKIETDLKKSPDDLTSVEVLGFMAKLRQLEDKE